MKVAGRSQSTGGLRRVNENSDESGDKRGLPALSRYEECDRDEVPDVPADSATGLEAIALHKCYQMTAATFAHVMRLATLPAGRSLRTACLSYIDFDGDKWLVPSPPHRAVATSLAMSGGVSGVSGDDGDVGQLTGGDNEGMRKLGDVVAAAVESVDTVEGVSMTRFIGDEGDMESNVRRARLMG